MKEVNQLSENKIRALFSAFEEHSIRSSIWKSRDRWSDSIIGKTDIDLLISHEQIKLSDKVLLQQGWVPLKAESWRNFKDVFDYILIIDGKVLHLHVHGQIVSGDKMVKNLRPPLTNLYLKHTPQNTYPPFVKIELEYVLFLLRVSLKLSWLDIAGALKRRSWQAIFRYYIDEYNLLRESCDLSELLNMLNEPEFEHLPKQDILQIYDDFNQLTPAVIYRLRASTSNWRSINGPQFYFISFVRRLKKYWQGSGKLLMSNGLSIAICGPDGSGKTTLVKTVQKVLTRQLLVQKFYMGGNTRQTSLLRGILIKSLWPPYLIMRKFFKIIQIPAAVKLCENSYYGLNSFLLRREKISRLVSANKASQNGSTVIFERYPLFTPFGDDMKNSVHQPNIQSHSEPDLIVVLNIDLNSAKSRRPNDNPEILKKKIEAFRNFGENPGSNNSQILHLNANNSLNENLELVLGEISKQMSLKTKDQLNQREQS